MDAASAAKFVSNNVANKRRTAPTRVAGLVELSLVYIIALRYGNWKAAQT